MFSYSQYLKHHGIKGQQWGVRRGPPYPLNSQQSSSKKTTSYGSTVDKPKSKGDNSKKKRKGLTKKQKTAIALGAAAVATALAAYGGYKLYKSGKLDNLIGKGKEVADSLENEKVSKVLELGAGNGMKGLGANESLSDTMKTVSQYAGKKNCSSCSMATFLRQQGYDVTPLDDIDVEINRLHTRGGKQMAKAIREAFPDADVRGDGENGSLWGCFKFCKSKQDASDFITQRFGDNASGVCCIGKWTDANHGHFFNWSVKDGVCTFFDGQANIIYDDNIIHRIQSNSGLIVARLDNCDFSKINLDALKDIVNIK